MTHDRRGCALPSRRRGPTATVGLLVSGTMLAVALALPAGAEEPSGLPLEGQQAEEFLRSARVVGKRALGTGITNSKQLTLNDGRLTTRAVFKTINEHRLGLTHMEFGTEFDFRDSYKSEIAAYELDKILGLGLVPPTVERRIDGRTGSLQMWVEGAHTEDEKKKLGLDPPDVERWNAEMYKVRLLHQLTYNTDRQNVRNVLFDSSFRLYAIDSSRAFHIQTELQAPDELVCFCRPVVEALSRLDRRLLEQRLGRWLSRMQIRALLARRDLILELVQQRVREKGESEALYP
jgi:hypothetical protein